MDSSLHSQMSTSTDNTTIAQAQTTSSTNHPNPTRAIVWSKGAINGRRRAAARNNPNVLLAHADVANLSIQLTSRAFLLPALAAAAAAAAAAGLLLLFANDDDSDSAVPNTDRVVLL